MLDGHILNHTKQASLQIKAVHERSRIDAIQARFKVLAVSSKINDVKATEVEMHGLDKLNTAAKKLEQNSTIHLLTNFRNLS